MSDSVQSHRQQPARLPCPWDSPGKNTGGGCHFLLQCVKVKSLSRVRLLADPVDCSPPGSSIHGIFQARVPESGAIAFSATHRHALCFRFCSHIGHYRELSSCAVWYTFTSYLFYVQTSTPTSSVIQPSLSPLVNLSLFSTSVTQFVSVNRFICTIFFEIPHISNII